MEKLTKHVEMHLALHKMEWYPRVKSDMICIIEEDIKRTRKAYQERTKR